MAEQTPIVPTNPPSAPVSDVDQIKVNVGTGSTTNFRNVAIPGRIKRRKIRFMKIFYI